MGYFAEKVVNKKNPACTQEILGKKKKVSVQEYVQERFDAEYLPFYLNTRLLSRRTRSNRMSTAESSTTPASVPASPAKKSKAKAGARKRGTPSKKAVSRTVRSGLTFSVGRVDRWLNAHKMTERKAAKTAIVATAILEQVMAEVVQTAGDFTKEQGKTRITPRLIQQSIFKDVDLRKILGSAKIVGGGVEALRHVKFLPLAQRKRME